MTQLTLPRARPVMESRAGTPQLRHEMAYLPGETFGRTQTPWLRLALPPPSPHVF